VAEAGGAIPLIAKLERGVAVEHVREIAAEADALMVARGDLGVEVPLHQVPVLQKRIIAAGRRLGKPVIVATQMLESMMEQPRPTRAEASDVANAVFDGADALMLSGETAAGRFPVEAVRTMARIVREAEAYQLRLFASGTPPPARELPSGRHPAPAPGALDPADTRSTRAADLAGAIEIADVVAAAGVHAASKLERSHVVAFSQGGFTAQRIARYRPAAATVVFTTDERVARRIQLFWGVDPIRLEHEIQGQKDLVQNVERELLSRKLVRRGDCLVLLMGHPIEERPLTNLLRIHRIASK